MVAYSPVAPTYRTPYLIAMVSGHQVPRIIAGRISRGFDQDLAVAQLTIPYPLPDYVHRRSMIRVYMGTGATAVLRFVGYITSLDMSMYPGRIVLGCEDLLALAKYYRPTIGADLAGMTDQAAIKMILGEVGLPYTDANIGGTGKVLGDDSDANPALEWSRTTSALSMIQQIDQVSIYDTDDGFKGIYRTLCSAGGQILRIPLHPLPSDTPAHTFTEGVDVYTGSSRIEAVEPSNVASVAGAHGYSVTKTGTNPWAVISNPFVGLYPLLDVVGPSVSSLNLDALAQYLLQQMDANVLRIDLTTFREDLIGANETERFISPHAYVDILALLQSVTTDISERGGFTQQLSLVSYRELNISDDPTGGLPPIDDNPVTGDPIPTPDPPVLPAPTEADITPSFSVTLIEAEKVLVSGAYGMLTTVACEDTSSSATGTITAWAWTAGGGGTPSSGTGQTFNPSWAGDLTGATVTLAVTDSNGNTATSEATPITGSMGTPTRQRKLYTAESGGIAAFDGAAWHDQPSSAAVVVANGAYWGDGEAVLSTADDLSTTPATVTPLAGAAVSSLWIELDVSTSKLAVGLAGGRVMLSTDSGLTWTVCTPLANTGEDVLQVILSRSTPGQVWALQASAISVSDDSGTSWRVLRAAAGGQSFIALRLTNFRNLVSSTGGPSPLETVEAGTPFTFTGTAPTELTGIAVNTYADEVTAISADTPPTLWVTDAPGSFNMVPAETPDLSAFSGAAPYPRNLQQDGTIARQVYAAVGDYALKTTDFWKTDSIHVLRHVGEGGAGAGPIVMIGQGDLGTPATGSRLYILGVSGTLYKSTDDGATWAPTAAHGAASPSVFAALGGAGGADTIYVPDVTALRKSTDGGATWASVATPASSFVGWVTIATDGTVVISYDSAGWAVSTNGGTSWTSFALADGQFDRFEAATAKLWTMSSLGGARTTRSNLSGSGEESIALASGWLSAVAPRAVSDTIALLVSGRYGNDLNLLDKVVGTTATTIVPAGSTLTQNGWWDAASPDGTTIIAHIWDATTDDAADTGQIWHSTDGGSSWTKVLDTIDLQPGGNNDLSLAFAPNDPAKCYALGGQYQEFFARNLDARVFASADGGATWNAGVVVAAGEYAFSMIRTVSG